MTRTLDLRIESSGAPKNAYIKHGVRTPKKHCAMSLGQKASVTTCNG